MSALTRITVEIDEDTATLLERRADIAHQPVSVATARLLRQAVQSLPDGRSIILGPQVLETLEIILQGGSLLNAADLIGKVSYLAGISFEHKRLPFTPQQLDAIAAKAERQGLTVDQLLERVVPRLYAEFFDLLGVS